MALACFGMFAFGHSSADAQSAAGLPQPTFSLTDSQHVDLVSQLPILSFTDVTIGSPERQLVHSIWSASGGSFLNLTDSYMGYIQPDTDPHGYWWYDVVVGGKTSHFYPPNGLEPVASVQPWPPITTTFVEAIPQGEKLALNADGSVTFTFSDGTIAIFSGSAAQTYIHGNLLSIQKPTGEIFTLNYAPISNFVAGDQQSYVQSVTTNFGFQLLYGYTAADFNQSIQNYPPVTAFNSTIDYCAPTAQTCSFSRSWPTASYAWAIPNPPQADTFLLCPQETSFYNTFTITDASGRQASVYSNGMYQVQTVQEFGYNAPNISYTYHQQCNYLTSNLSSNRVLTAVRNGATYTYKAWAPTQGQTGNPNPLSPYPGMWVYGPTDPLNNTTLAVLQVDPFAPDIIGNPDPKYSPGAAMPLGLVLSTDSTVTNLAPDQSARVGSIVKPEGGVATYTYDGRGNLLTITEAAKTGSSLAARVSSANYDATCTYPAKCNKPNWVIDRNGGRTDYVYDPNSGVLLVKTLPSVATAAVTSDTTSCKTSAAQPYCVRPQSRFTYTQRYAWVKNAAGAYAKAATPIWVLTKESECRTGPPSTSAFGASGCSLAGDEIVTTFEYGADAGPNNLFLKGKVVDATGQALRTCYAYDALGEKTSQTSPRGNTGTCP